MADCKQIGNADLPQFNEEEQIQGLREIGMLEWIYHLRATYPPWEGPKDMPFHQNFGK